MASTATKRSDSFDPSSSKTPHHKYDVFLSFRGEDVRGNFLEYLYRALLRKGILTFKDDVKLEDGKKINDNLLGAIEESRLSIVVLSKNYADSSWCLRELVHILECKKAVGQVVYPVFYHVSPSDVRKQGGNFGEGFAKACTGKEEGEEVNRWKDSLEEVGNLKGWAYPNAKFENEASLIDNLVHKIFDISNGRYRILDEELVGIGSRIEQVIKLLDLGSEETRVVGLWGMGGIGKTTLAKAVYDSISWQFEGCCSFVENVTEIIKKSGKGSLQKQIFLDTLKGDDSEIRISTLQSSIIDNRICRKKLLIVLDDVSKPKQVEDLVKKLHLFSHGSRVIITTRDKHVLTVCGAHVFNVQELNEDEAAQLFKSKAFSRKEETKEFQKVIRRALNYAKGIPLALKVLGSFLKDRTMTQWKSALDRMTECPDDELQQVLRISYGDLNWKDKEIFLDIACFYKSMEKDRVIKILECCGLNPILGIELLVEKSLLTISADDKLGMHDLIQKMGRSIADEESREEPGERRRLWRTGDIKRVLTEKTGTRKVEGLFLSDRADVLLEPDAFAKMTNLRLLWICGTCRPRDIPCQLRFLEWVLELCGPRCSISLPNKLRVLYWDGYPFKSMPSTFQPELLVELHLVNSPIQQLWGSTTVHLIPLFPEKEMLPIALTILNSFKLINVQQVLPMLTLMDLSYSTSLTKSPDYTAFPNLEHLALKDCTALVEIDPSIKYLKKLRILNVEGCSRLKTLPYGIKSQCLEILNFSWCPKLDNILERFGELKRLLDLNLKQTGITELPDSIGYSTDILDMNFAGCRKLKSLPSSIGKLKKLKSLSLDGCSSLNSLPEELGHINSLLRLYLSGVRQLPEFVLQLINLERLSLRPFFSKTSLSTLQISSSTSLDFSGLLYLTWLRLELRGLTSFPESLVLCRSLQELWLGGDFESLPESIKDLKNLCRLVLYDCPRLQELPELPPCVTRVSAGSCDSLRTICSAVVLRDASELDFTDCPKLVGSKEIETISGFKFLYDQIKENKHEKKIRKYSYQGSKIPEWNRYRSSGCSLKLQLPATEDLYNSKVLGFALSAVVATKHHQAYISVKLKFGERYFPKVLRFNSFPSNSKNVCVSFYPLQEFAVDNHINTTENIFEVRFVELVSSYQKREPDGRLIEECGLHPIYDVEEFESVEN